MSQIVITKPEKCHLWTAPLTKEVLFFGFDDVKCYLNSYHNTRELKKCKVCGQLYFAEYYEEINFSGDEDDVYYTFIPVDSVEMGDRLNDLSMLELGGFLGIFMNFPPYNSQPYWHNR